MDPSHLEFRVLLSLSFMPGNAIRQCESEHEVFANYDCYGL